MHLATNKQRLLHTRQQGLTGLMLLICLALSWSNAASARAPLPYHIEVVVFERSLTPSSAPELWSPNIVLAYPPNYRIIAPAQAVDGDTSNGEAASGTHHARSVSAIDESRYLLAPQAKKLRGKSNYRVLFHKAWEQTLGRDNQAPSIVISGGELFDGRHELGGTIRFSVNKYIHVETDLWLSRFTPNLGQANIWPPIPMAPHISDFNTDGAHAYSGNAAPISLDEPLTLSASKNFQYNQTNSNLAQGFSTTRNEYLSDRIVTMKQSIRMRSKELNYLDHPVLGVLIKIVPNSYSSD